MTDVGLVLYKLAQLRRQLRLIVDRRPASANELGTNDVVRDALAMAFLVAVQQVVDVAYHIVADEGWGVPASHGEAFADLADHDVIAGETARRLRLVAQVRNRIAHGYTSLDHERFWTELPDGIDVLTRFLQEVAAWLPEP